MPDGARNGLTSESKSDTVFLCDESEDEEDESGDDGTSQLKKSSNSSLKLFFDLFSAAMEGKIGEKKGYSSLRMSTGPRDSDFVLLAPDQKQKEDAIIIKLIERLRANGVTCIFFKTSESRNGTIKHLSEALLTPKPKQPRRLSNKNSSSEASSPSSSGDEDPAETTMLSSENDSKSPSPPLPLSATLGTTSNLLVQKHIKTTCNGISTVSVSSHSEQKATIITTPNSAMPLLSNNAKRLDDPDGTTPSETSHPLDKLSHVTTTTTSFPSPLPPLLSPQIELRTPESKDNHSEEDAAAEPDINPLEVIPQLNAHPLQYTNLLSSTPTQTKAKGAKKRRRRKKYPYSSKRPAKKNIWKELVQKTVSVQDVNNTSITSNSSSSSSIGSSSTATTTIPANTNTALEANASDSKDLSNISSWGGEGVRSSGRSRRATKPLNATYLDIDLDDDPYAFIPEDDLEDPTIEPLFSPKKARKNGVCKGNSSIINRNKAAVLVKVFGGDIMSRESVSPPLRKKASEDLRPFSPDIATAIPAVRKRVKMMSPLRTPTASPTTAPTATTPTPLLDVTPVTVPPPVMKRRGRKKKTKRPYTRKTIVQNTNNCVHPISSTEEDKKVRLLFKEEKKDENVIVKEEESLLSMGNVVDKNENGDEDVIPSPLTRNILSSQKELIKVKDAVQLPSKGSLKADSEEMDGDLKTDIEFAKDEQIPPILMSALGLKDGKGGKGTKEKDITNSTNSAQDPTGTEVVVAVPPNLMKSLEGATKSTKTDTTHSKPSSSSSHPSHEFLPPPSDPSFMDSMQLRRPSFYSQIAGNVRNNLENYLDGRMTEVKKSFKRKKLPRNGFLLHHGDNFPNDPEAPYKLHLDTQITLKLITNRMKKRSAKFKPKATKGKSFLSYLQLVPKRVSRAARSAATQPNEEVTPTTEPEEANSVFSGEWIRPMKHICNVCGHIEDDFWDMVTHKGEIHPGVVVTHVELPDSPPLGFRVPPPVYNTSNLPPPPPCTKCSASFSTYPDLHRHIFECAGNAAWLQEEKDVQRKKKSKRKRGFKRRLSNTPKKKNETIKKRGSKELFSCELGNCTKKFKTEGWLKNHLASHSLPISIPLDKVTLPPTRAAYISSRRSCTQNVIANKT